MSNVFNARIYGSIQAAVTAAQNAVKSIVYVPEGTWAVNSSIISSTLNPIIICGAGRGTVLQATSGLGASPMIWAQNPAGVGTFRYGLQIANLLLQNTTASSAIGIQLDLTYFARLANVDIEGIYAQNIYLNGPGGANGYGAYTTITQCHLGPVPGGSGSGGIGILTNNHEYITIRDSVINWYNVAGGYGMKLQNGNCVIDGCTFDECDTSVWNFFSSDNSIVNSKFTRGLTQFIYLNGCKYSHVNDNVFGQFVGVGSKTILNVDNGANASNVIRGNTVESGTGWTNFVNEAGGTGTPGNIYIGNDTAGLTINRVSGVFDDNRGYNPVGSLTAPGIPTSATPFTNPFGVDCTVQVTGGTVSAIAIGGAGTFTTGPAFFRVPAGQTITLTYTVAPTWAWWGD